ncbi:MAG: hypothetical protein ACOCX4_08475 [Planctomycetota bacterium]
MKKLFMSWCVAVLAMTTLCVAEDEAVPRDPAVVKAELEAAKQEMKELGKAYGQARGDAMKTDGAKALFEKVKTAGATLEAMIHQKLQALGGEAAAAVAAVKDFEEQIKQQKEKYHEARKNEGDVAGAKARLNELTKGWNDARRALGQAKKQVADDPEVKALHDAYNEARKTAEASLEEAMKAAGGETAALLERKAALHDKMKALHHELRAAQKTGEKKEKPNKDKAE